MDYHNTIPYVNFYSTWINPYEFKTTYMSSLLKDIWKRATSGGNLAISSGDLSTIYPYREDLYSTSRMDIIDL